MSLYVLLKKMIFYKMLNIMYEDTYTNCVLNNYEYLNDEKF